MPRCFLNGCFDLLHFGHVNALRQVKDYTDSEDSLDDPTHVIAGIHSNAEIRRVKGGAFLSEEAEKERLLLACKFVDEVIHDVGYGEIHPKDLNEKYQRDVQYVFHGDDEIQLPLMEGESQESEKRDMYGRAKKEGLFRYVRRTEGISTTLLIQRMIEESSGKKELNSEVSTKRMIEERSNSSTKNPLSLNSEVSTTTSSSVDGTPPNKISNLSTATQSTVASTTVINNIPSTVQEQQSQQTQTKINPNSLPGAMLASTKRIVDFAKYSQPKPTNTINKSVSESQSAQSIYSPIIYLEGEFDLLHCGYVDIIEKVFEEEYKRFCQLKGIKNNLNDNDDSLIGVPISPDRGCVYSKGKDRFIRTHGMKSKKIDNDSQEQVLFNPYLILGIQDQSPSSKCVQTLHERALLMLSLRGVDEVIFGAEFIQKRQFSNWKNFKNALELDRVYLIRGHEDFKDQYDSKVLDMKEVEEVMVANGYVINSTNNESNSSSESESFDFIISLDCSANMTKNVILDRFQSNMENFKNRQSAKSEPGVCERK